MTVTPEGFSEAGISTRDLEGWLSFFRQVGGYQEIWRGESPDSIKTLWQIPTGEAVLECLLGHPDDTSGFIRLFQFEHASQDDIRKDAHAWDSGGIFDLDFRVSKLLPFVEIMQARGWKGVSHPVDWTFGQSQVREWLARGPDAVTIALMERLAPPLENWDGRQNFSHVFNSSQVVADMGRAINFYRKLGFVEIVHHHDPLPGNGGEVLGLAPDMAARTVVELVILQARGVMDGSVELVSIEHQNSQNYASRGKPYNLGLNLLRFPVANLRGYLNALTTEGIRPVNGRLFSTRIEPFGQVELIAVQTPDGAWLEFYQVLD